jgi:hypothetical protein
MKGWTIGRKLLVAAGLMFSLAAVGGLATMWIGRSLQGSTTRAQRALETETAHVQLARAVAQVGAEQALALAAASDKDTAAYEGHTRTGDEAARVAHARVGELRTILPAGPAQERLGDLAAALNEYESAVRQLQAQVTAGKLHEAVQVSEGAAAAAMDKMVRSLDEAGDAIRMQMKTAVEAGAGSAGALYMLVIILILLQAPVLGAGAYIVRTISHDLSRTTGELRRGAEQVSAVSSQVSSSVQSLSQGATEQAASLEETSASGGDGLDDAQERRERTAGRNARHGRGGAGPAFEHRADRNGVVDGRHQGVQRQGRQDHQDD